MFLYCFICYWNIGYSWMLVWWWLTVWKMLWCDSGRGGMCESKWVLLDSHRRGGGHSKRKLSLKRGALAWARTTTSHPLFILRARLGEGHSLEREYLAWASWANLSETSTCPLFAVSPRQGLVAWARDLSRLSESPLAWARTGQDVFQCGFFCVWLLVTWLIGLPYLKYKVCEYAWNIWLYGLELMSLVWAWYEIFGWLDIYWHEIGMHGNSMIGW